MEFFSNPPMHELAITSAITGFSGAAKMNYRLFTIKGLNMRFINIGWGILCHLGSLWERQAR